MEELELEIVTKPPKVRLIYDEIREFQSVKPLSKKINNRWAIRLLSNPTIDDWLKEHGNDSSTGKLSFCNAVTSAYIIYLTETPKSCTATEISTVNKSAKSLKYSLPEILPGKAKSPDFISGLNDLISFSPSTLSATASKKGDPAKRALIQNIATNIYGAFFVLPSNKIVTILVSISNKTPERSVRNTYNSDFKDNITKNKFIKDETYNKNISRSEQSSNQIINKFKIKAPATLEPTAPKTDIDRINAAIVLLEGVKSNNTIAREISILKNEVYELKSYQAITYHYIGKGSEIKKMAFSFPPLS